MFTKRKYNSLPSTEIDSEEEDTHKEQNHHHHHKESRAETPGHQGRDGRESDSDLPDSDLDIDSLTRVQGTIWNRTISGYNKMQVNGCEPPPTSSSSGQLVDLSGGDVPSGWLGWAASKGIGAVGVVGGGVWSAVQGAASVTGTVTHTVSGTVTGIVSPVLSPVVDRVMPVSMKNTLKSKDKSD